MEQAGSDVMPGEVVMKSWRQTVAVSRGLKDVARNLCKLNIIKPAVIKEKKIIKKAVTKP